LLQSLSHRRHLYWSYTLQNIDRLHELNQ